MIDLYSEWRNFYLKRVSSWMSLEELRAECGKLQTVDNLSPEVLLMHAMHALEELQAKVERLKSMTAVTMGIGNGSGNLFVHGDYDSIKAVQALVFRVERLAKALRLIESAKDRGFGIDYARGVAHNVLLQDQEEGLL